MRLLSPDGACVSVDVPTAAGTRRYDGRTIEVTDPAHIKALRQVGYTAGDVAGRPATGGRVCETCGFVAFFTTCSRCGGRCTRRTD